MSYVPATDFLALTRQTKGGVRVLRMPGLDYVMEALARIGLFQVWVAQTAPPTALNTTVWLKPAFPNSWAAEGVIYLYDAASASFLPATPALWSAFLSATTQSGVFQSVTGAAANLGISTTLLAIQRAAPVTTVITLPLVSVRIDRPVQIVDWSTGIVNHEITLNAAGGNTIMQRASFNLFSTADQLAGITLYPSMDLNGWVIAP